jgi:hypothetical protein
VANPAGDLPAGVSLEFVAILKEPLYFVSSAFWAFAGPASTMVSRLEDLENKTKDAKGMLRCRNI